MNETIRSRARKDIESGAVTFGYGADRGEGERLLKEEHADDLVSLMHGLRVIRVREAPILRLHTPHPQSDPDPPRPDHETPEPSVPPDMEPVVPVQDPPPGRGADGEPPPVIAGFFRSCFCTRSGRSSPGAPWTSTAH